MREKKRSRNILQIIGLFSNLKFCVMLLNSCGEDELIDTCSLTRRHNYTLDLVFLCVKVQKR